MGKGGKLGHVADACGEGDGGGPATEQGQKPLRRLAGAAAQGGGDPLHALGAQGRDGRKAPSGKGEPVEESLGHDRPGRGGAETPKTQHRLRAGEGLEAGSPAGGDGPTGEPADAAAGGVGNDDHAGEPIRPPAP